MPELRDATVTSYVRDVGKRLVRAAPGPKYPYSFAVADLARSMRSRCRAGRSGSIAAC